MYIGMYVCTRKRVRMHTLASTRARLRNYVNRRRYLAAVFADDDCVLYVYLCMCVAGGWYLEIAWAIIGQFDIRFASERARVVPGNIAAEWNFSFEEMRTRAGGEEIEGIRRRSGIIRVPTVRARRNYKRIERARHAKYVVVYVLCWLDRKKVIEV